MLAMTLDRKTILTLAAEAEVNERTIRRAEREGVGVIKGEAAKERIRKAAKKLGVKLRD
jgi:hypothetical protein